MHVKSKNLNTPIYFVYQRYKQSKTPTKRSDHRIIPLKDADGKEKSEGPDQTATLTNISAILEKIFLLKNIKQTFDFTKIFISKSLHSVADNVLNF